MKGKSGGESIEIRFDEMISKASAVHLPSIAARLRFCWLHVGVVLEHDKGKCVMLLDVMEQALCWRIADLKGR